MPENQTQQNTIDIARIEVKIDNLTSMMERIEEQTTKTNGRVSILENWKSWITGIGLVISAIFGFKIW